MAEPNAAKHPIRPTDLAAAMAWSVPYASQVLTGERPPTINRSIAIFDKTGIRLGPIKDASDDEIVMLRKFTEAA